MMVIENNNQNTFYRKACIVMIWFISAYASIIQYVYFEISNAMLMLGAIIFALYILANNGNICFREALTEENECLLYFMAYMLVVGFLTSPDRNSHVSQWITCMEYLFLQIVIASIIKNSGTDSFHILVLAEAIVLAVYLLWNPVEYGITGRYSISKDFNPNGLGMYFVAGIWAVLYRQQKTKISLILIGAVIALLLGYCILLTGSRKSLIGAGLTITLWLFFCFFPSIKGKGYYGITAVIIILFLIIIIGWGFLSVYVDSKLAERMKGIFEEITEGKRSNMYRDGFDLLKMSPLFGIGFQGFSYYYGVYSHATVVEIPVSGGIIGTVWYFCAYFISIRKMISIYKITKRVKEYESENIKIKMVFIFFILMCFYTVCIIHPYQFSSGIQFGIIFGETAYLENKICLKQEPLTTRKIGSKYIKV